MGGRERERGTEWVKEVKVFFSSSIHRNYVILAFSPSPQGKHKKIYENKPKRWNFWRNIFIDKIIIMLCSTWFPVCHPLAILPFAVKSFVCTSLLRMYSMFAMWFFRLLHSISLVFGWKFWCHLVFILQTILIHFKFQFFFSSFSFACHFCTRSICMSTDEIENGAR